MITVVDLENWYPGKFWYPGDVLRDAELLRETELLQEAELLQSTGVLQNTEANAGVEPRLVASFPWGKIILYGVTLRMDVCQFGAPALVETRRAEQDFAH